MTRVFGRRRNKDNEDHKNDKDHKDHSDHSDHSEPSLPPTDEPPVAPDALQSARLLSDAVFDGLVTPLKMQRGVPTPDVVAMLGALAGHACQVATLRGIAAKSPDYRDLSIVTVQGANGDRYLMGDAINRPVLEWQYSVWALVAGITEHLGVPRPDLPELASYGASTVGGATFGVPRDLPTGSTTPMQHRRLWDGTRHPPRRADRQRGTAPVIQWIPGLFERRA
jgi:hypothetical protein